MKCLPPVAAFTLACGAAAAQIPPPPNPDLNHDGKVTLDEFRRMRPGGRLDADKDGVVTRAEREAAQLLRFPAADTNHDGWLSKGELLMMRQNRARGG